MINNKQVALINATFQKYAPKKIGLFGSRVRGDGNSDSDLDILVSFEGEGKSPYSLLELLSLERTLEEKLGFPVDIVNEKNIQTQRLKESILPNLLIIFPEAKT